MSETPRDAVIRTRFKHPGEKSEFDVWRRVAAAWARTDGQADQFYHMMATGMAFPNTPAIANAGRSRRCGSACFVLPIDDSLYGDGSITGTLSDATRVHQYGGGTGFSFNSIRAKGSLVSTTGREAPGPVSFLQGYSAWFKGVSQAGLRPAANMAILHCDHPDISDFILCKTREGDISNFNISVAVTDEFMEHRDNGKSELWTEIIDGAWRNGEPGVFFTDTVNNTRLHPERIYATNPCGEVPLLPYEACVLGSVDLAKHITRNGDVNWDQLEQTVRLLVQMLDNIVEYQDYPLDIIKETHHKYRKIGVGVMGFADALIKMGIRYGHPYSVVMAEDLMSFIQAVSYAESERLGAAHGNFPGYWEAVDFLKHRGINPNRRNLCVQVLAPTGTISWLAGSDHNRTSPGIEPNYGREGENFIMGGVYEYRHSLGDSEYFVSYDEVTPEQHIAIQSAFQKHTDQAVSKTINLPHEATHKDVESVYTMAWESGCKGTTVYREGSREEVVLKPKGAVEAECVGGTCAL